MGKGFWGKYVRINLSDSSVKFQDVPEELMKKFLGARGLASKFLFDEVNPTIDPLSIENKLIFAPGPLSGTTAPTGGRYDVVTKGPLTGTIAASNSGGFFGAELKFAGYDMVIIEGKAEKPVYISIKDDDIKIEDAADLWGKDTHVTTDMLLDKFGDKRARVACIGPAGEKLVKFAAIINDKDRAAGRTGVGAVMGSKNLKAIVVRGSKRVEVANPEEFKAVVREKISILKENGTTGQGLPTYGTKVLDNIINQNGLYPTRNFQTGVFEKTEPVSGEALVDKYLVRNKACFACPIGCGRVSKLPSGLEGEGPEYETGWAFGADCGVSDLNAIIQANFICNELGLDTITTGSTIACAMELYEKGHLPKDMIGKAPEPAFGSSEAIVYYSRAIGCREGLGDKLAEGSYRFADSLGHPEFSMSVKKQEMPAYDPRGAQGHALEYATSNRGGCHVRGYMISPEILGVPEKLDPQQIEGKDQWVKTFQDLTAIIDAAGLCLFTSFALGLSDYTDLINPVTGFGYTDEELLRVGERIWNLERIFNLKAGIGPEQDTLPKRLIEDPMPDGPNKGHVARISEMLPMYYNLRGWGTDGIPKEEKLKELGLA